MDLHLAIGISNLAALIGILWKGSVLVERVEMMWRVFAAEHGLDPSSGSKNE